MKLTTLNLQGFTNWADRKANIIHYLKETDPDIVMFQEVVYLPEVAEYNQVQLLNQSLFFPFEQNSVTRLQVGLEYETYREGLGVLSRFPITKSESVVLKKDSRDQHYRIVQMLDVDVGGTTVLFANIHLSLSDTIDFASPQLEEVLSLLSLRGEERIIAGDFNLEHLENTASLWQDTYRISTTSPYVSFPSMNKCIDYVLIPKVYKSGETTLSEDGLSDHRALTVEIFAGQ